MTTTTPTRAEATALRARIAEAIAEPMRRGMPPIHGFGEHYALSVSAKHRTVDLAWAGLPDVDEIRAVVAPLVDGTGFDLRLTQQWAWSDGRCYADERAAFLARRGHEIETIDTGDDYGDGYYDRVIESAEDAYDRLAAAGADLDPGVVPGTFVACGCSGGRRLVSEPRPHIETCNRCEGRGVFDLSDPDDRARYDALWAAAVDEQWARWHRLHPEVPTIADYAAHLAGDDAARIERIIRRLLDRDRQTLDRWRTDPSTR